MRSLPLFFCLLCAVPAFSQVDATITGTVVDASGGVIRGATITVTAVETAISRTTTTDDSGSFSVPSLRPGPHEIKAEKPSFRPAVRTGIHLAVGQNAVFHLRLELGDISQAIVVTGDVPVINTTTSSVSGFVSEREIRLLPLNGRSFDNLITINPGTLNYVLKSAGTSTSNGNTFSVGGRRPLENLFLLNGVEYTGSSQLAVTPGGVSGSLLGVDAVREFNILADNYSAEFGKRAGGQITVITQSGGNQIHGSIFEFLRNSALDAPGYFDQGTTPPFRRNQFGGSLGGPIKRNRLFLFGNYEGFRQRLAVSNVAVVPNAQARQGLLPNASGTYVPVANLNINMLPFMAMWPTANGPELLANGLPTGTALSYNSPKQSIREDFGTMRFDYTPREADSISSSYTIDDGTNASPLADPLFGSYTVLRSQVATLQHQHIFSPRTINQATIGFSRAAFNYDSFALGAFPESLSFVKGAGPGGIVIGGGATTTGVAALTSAGPGNAAFAWNRRNLMTYSDNLSLYRGKHQIKVGVWFQRLQNNDNSISRRVGQANFTSLTTFLQGTVSNFQAAPNPGELGWRSLFGAWYFDDNIQLHRNLNIRVGLRHEFSTGWNEVVGRAGNWITDANGVLNTAPRIANSAFTENRAKRLFGPRVGLAWNPFGTGKTSVRAGYGLYYTMLDALSFQLNTQPPVNGSIAFPNGTSLFSIIPLIPGATIPAQCGAGVTPCTTYAPQGVQGDAHTQAVNKWNFSIEQELTPETSLRLSYVGSFGYHGLLSIDPNAIAPQICASAAGCTAGGLGNATSRSTVAQGAQYIPLGTRPNPNLSAGFFWFTEGNSSYNALQLDITRRLARGFQIRGNYTWSKNLDMNSGLTGAQTNNQAQMVLDRFNLRRDWGPSALDAKQQLSLSGSYELPFAKRNRILGGWNVNGIATFLSGFPFTPQAGSNRSGDGNTRNPDRPNFNPSFTGDVILGQQTRWYDPNAFVLPAFGTWGNVGRGTFRGPGLANVDLSLAKDVPVAEGKELQLRAEFFNAFDRANFGPPNSLVFSGTTISPSAGLITTTTTQARQIQLSLKLVF